MTPERIKIYTRRGCGYCTQAERLLRGKGLTYQQLDVTDDPATRRWLAEVTGQTTVPQIFLDGVALGGYTDVAALDRAGELDRLLARR